jgi:hypothetical protein
VGTSTGAKIVHIWNTSVASANAPGILSTNDALLKTVKKFIKSHWLDLKILLQHTNWSQLEGFYRCRESLTIEQGCVLFREHVVIPTTLRAKVLKLLHQGHPRIQQMKSLACNYAYWLGMDHEIEEMVHGCGPCAVAAKQSLKATLHSWPPATKPWECIHIDFAGPHLGWHFLIVVDAYSKYPVVISAPNTTSRQTVTISDNGTQFTSGVQGVLQG